ncbi:MAG: dihydrofolate reductase family protein [Candidatus Sulfotelmatobacter sp.]
MRKLKIMEHISLDGVIQSDDSPHGNWTAPYRTPAGRDAVFAAHGGSFDVLLGRRTYDQWSDFWPKAPSSPMSDALNAATKYVVTHRPESLEWGPFVAVGPGVVGTDIVGTNIVETNIVGTNIVDGIRRIKSQDGPDLVLWGSSTLTSTLLEHGLADEVVLIVYPVLLGKGKRLFAEGTPPRAFEPASTKAFSSGVVINTYKFAGPLKN